MHRLLSMLEGNTSLPSDGIKWTRPKRINGVSKESFTSQFAFSRTLNMGVRMLKPHKLNIGL